MKIKHKFCYLLSIGILCSCASFKTTQLGEGQIELTNNNLGLINGTYYKAQKNKDNMDVFWAYFSTIFTKDQYGEKTFYYSKLQKIGDRQIEVAFLNSNYMVIKTNKLRGKIKHGYFEVNTRLGFVPIIIANVFKSKKIRIGLSDNSNLTTDYKSSGFGTFLLYPIAFTDVIRNIEYIKWPY